MWLQTMLGHIDVMQMHKEYYHNIDCLLVFDFMLFHKSLTFKRILKIFYLYSDNNEKAVSLLSS